MLVTPYACCLVPRPADQVGGIHHGGGERGNVEVEHWTGLRPVQEEQRRLDVGDEQRGEVGQQEDAGQQVPGLDHDSVVFGQVENGQGMVQVKDRDQDRACHQVTHEEQGQLV